MKIAVKIDQNKSGEQVIEDSIKIDSLETEKLPWIHHS